MFSSTKPAWLDAFNDLPAPDTPDFASTTAPVIEPASGASARSAAVA